AIFATSVSFYTCDAWVSFWVEATEDASEKRVFIALHSIHWFLNLSRKIQSTPCFYLPKRITLHLL
ncbi:unnamed protein product, partial [Musa acuminata subsp. burmannicoides]